VEIRVELGEIWFTIENRAYGKGKNGGWMWELGGIRD